MPNILDAIHIISELKDFKVDRLFTGDNRVNSMGAALEEFVANAFADSFHVDKKEKIEKWSKAFSYYKSNNYPPDFMLHGGDAIEVKKTKGLKARLQLNSSHPKDKLHSNSSLLDKECISCEKWNEKDMLYATGHVKNKQISTLSFVYGDLYTAREEEYLELKKNIQREIKEIPNINFAKTKELGKVKDVDPLKITELRIRGMWLIDNPNKVFNHIHENENETKFQLWALISAEKYDSFPKKSKQRIENNGSISIVDTQTPNPNNIADLINCKFIKYMVR